MWDIYEAIVDSIKYQATPDWIARVFNHNSNDDKPSWLKKASEDYNNL